MFLDQKSEGFQTSRENIQLQKTKLLHYIVSGCQIHLFFQ
jgi:hypothetical protein